MPIDPKYIEQIARQALQVDAEQRATWIERTCGSNRELQSQVEKQLALLLKSDSQTHATAAANDGFAPTMEPVSGSQGVDPISDSRPSESTAFFAPSTGKLTLIGQRYTLEEKIGEGGMGEVWIARQSQPIKRKVAIKLIKSGMDSRAVLARFDQERQALAMMDHPNIAKVYDAGVTETQMPYFAMELVRGQPLTEYCDAARLSPKQRLELFVPICQAVQHAHQKGIVHRDLKPANILVTSVDGHPVPKVIDFGVAKATSGKLTEETLSTGFGAVVGTLEYMSPEQAGATGDDIDTRADVYSLGIVLYELLTGLRPFEPERLKKAALSEMIRVIREDDPARPSTRLSTDAKLPSLASLRRTEPKRLMAELRGELDWVIMKCLEKDRERRYASANGLASDVSRFLTNEPIEARPPSAGYRVQKFVTRHQGFVIASSIVLLSLVGGIVGTTWGLIEASRQTEIADTQAAEAEIARQDEAQQRQIAEQANQQAVEALQSFTSDLMGNLLGSRDELTEIEKAVLENAQNQWEVFASAQGDSVSARLIRAQGAKNVAYIQMTLGFDQQAEVNDRKALTLRESLASDFPENAEFKEALARAHQQLGGTLRLIDKRAESSPHFENAARLYSELAEQFPDEPEHKTRYSESCISVGNVKRDFGEWEASEAWYIKARDTQETLLAEFPDSIAYLHSLARSHWGLAFLGQRRRMKTTSSGNYEKSIGLYEQLCERVPESLEYRQDLANLFREHGNLLTDFEDDELGAEQLAKAVPIQAAIVDEFPSKPRYRLDLARSRRDYGRALRYLNRKSEAAEQYEAAVDLLTKLASDHPTVLSYRFALGITYRMQGDLANSNRASETAIPLYQQAIDTLHAVHIQDRNVTNHRRALCTAHKHKASCLVRDRDFAAALEGWSKTLEYCDDDEQYEFQCQYADTLLRSGDVEEALLTLDELSLVENPSGTHWFRFARLYAMASEQLEARQNELAAESIALLKKAVDLGLDDAGRIESEEEFEPLTERADFKALVEALKEQ